MRRMLGESPQATSRRPSGAVRVLGVVAGLIVAAVIGWAAATVFIPPKDVLASTSYTTARVIQGQVGSSITLNAAAAWTSTPVGANLASGTVTSVNVTAGEQVSQGSVLYTVDLRPVVIAEGAVPAFRPISAGTKGADVSQLQQMLHSLGYFHRSSDGQAGAATTAAIRAWQQSIGVDADGVVQPGDVVYVPSLPTSVSLDPKLVSRGARLSGGEQVVSALPSAPTFTIPVTPAQAALVPAGTHVFLQSPKGATWEAIAGEQTTALDTGDTEIALTPTGQSPICAADCGQVAVLGQSLLPARIVTVATVKGLVVPTSSLISLPAGQAAVIDAKGHRHSVKIVASAEGLSVISGVAEGTSVRVPASSSE